MFPRVDVDSLRAAALMMAVGAPVTVAHLTVKGVHLLNPVCPHWILGFVVKSPAIVSISVLEAANLSFFELSLQRQVFGLI